jgi:O-antigen ligase
VILRIGRVAGTLGWASSAALFGTLLLSIRHVDHVGLVPPVLLLALAALTALRPLDGLAAGGAIVPVATFLAIRHWNGSVSWPAPIVCALLTGFSIHALFPAGRRERTPASLASPAICFAALVIAWIIVSLGVSWLRLGPAFGDALVTQVTREHFINLRGFLSLQAGLLLIEGVVLFVAAARLSASRPEALPRLAASLEIGALAALVATVWQLGKAAARGGAMWRSLVDLVWTMRWNATFGDINAAGSFYVMALLAAAGLALAAAGRTRALHAAAALCLAAALWLTGSRGALVACLVVVCGGIVVRRSRTSLAVWAVGIAGAVLAAGLAIMLLQPERGNQKSWLIAANVRLGLAQTAEKMIASRPAFGIGLAEFSRRSGEFSSPWLLAAFPPAAHENAHNNFLQVAAELGLIGGAAFVWLLAAAMRGSVRAASSDAPVAVLTCAALVAYMLTWLGGHPLLVVEAAVPFWILLGAAAGAGAPRDGWSRWRSIVTVAAVVAIIALLPSRMKAEMKVADLEHVGIGVSDWDQRDESERYRTATNRATLFVPTATGFKLKVKPLTDHPVDLELRLDGRIADRRQLLPGDWTEIRMPARTRRAQGQYAPLELRVYDPGATAVTIRMTKVEPWPAPSQ